MHTLSFKLKNVQSYGIQNNLGEVSRK